MHICVMLYQLSQKITSTLRMHIEGVTVSVETHRNDTQTGVSTMTDFASDLERRVLIAETKGELGSPKGARSGLDRSCQT
jgi:hypothetical protein